MLGKLTSQFPHSVPTCERPLARCRAPIVRMQPENQISPRAPTGWALAFSRSKSTFSDGEGPGAAPENTYTKYPPKNGIFQKLSVRFS